MSRSDHSPHRRIPGIAAVGVVGALLLAVVAGAVMWGRPGPDYAAAVGALRDYSAAPDVAWSIDDTVLPDYEGTGPVAIADQRGHDWLLTYPSGLGRAVLLLDGRTGEPRWPAPVQAGLGSCAIGAGSTVACAVKLGDLPDGFYLIDDDGGASPAGPLDDTVTVTAVGGDFLRIDQSGLRMSLRSQSGRVRWERQFDAAATPRMVDGLLTVATADGRSYVLNPTSGTDMLACAQCDLRVYPTGVLAVYTAPGEQRVEVFPRSRSGKKVAGEPVRTAASMAVVPGPSTLPVLTGVGADQVLAAAGRFEIVDPATGEGLWTIADPELSKSHARPCGTLVTFAMKDRSRRFFDLAGGTGLGTLPPPAIGDPGANLDVLRCVGSTGDIAVFAGGDKLTAFDAVGGEPLWDYDIAGPVLVVDGYLALIQGSELIVLQPR
ncbi:hypothetical protein GOHSU_27_00060 [Gordonia hirsuta DSM 44140 = NBRC 16056]|uniref:Pyrrolo-quinoline quinone repeat domain-containing protein n=1 Tax=Gordonia hirsuta DSM 44140 = NBRC 16056 TaxID=1121927 RepID=L7L9Q1_9ACTN|nr:PQQ-binding-like beta-propeller repeat protein [Gordonia hirsuta]GAC57870.1 hypothetical protein GOHSU_27_00060 [Gordonia hirsuta DSM 44140 = NBRC 16056]